jgi:NADH dehydrogenase [ubiquinone] 1 alpha subcomplex assembly factor 1
VRRAAAAGLATAFRRAENDGMSRELVRFASAGAVADWGAIDDGVMGGVSHSRLRHDPAGHAVFEGVVSLANNGGFASVRSRPLDFSAPGAEAFLVDVLGDGKRYKLALRIDDAFDGINYQAAFEPPAGVWTVVQLPVSGFRASFRGRDVAAAPALDPARVRQIGLMIADRQPGPFALAVRSIVAE